MKKIFGHYYFSPVLFQAQYKKGFGFTTGAWGSAFFLWGTGIKGRFIGFEMKFIDVKDGEMPAINYYTGRPINIGDDALIMFPLFAKIRYLPFEGMIANNFSPFIEFKAGVNYSVDGNGVLERFVEDGAMQLGGSYGGQFVVGKFPQ